MLKLKYAKANTYKSYMMLKKKSGKSQKSKTLRLSLRGENYSWTLPQKKKLSKKK